MNFHWPFGKAAPLPHAVVRYVAATADENTEAAAKRRDVHARLEAAVSTLTPEQRAAARDRAVGGRT